MNAEECRARASTCAANAAVSPDVFLSDEYLRLAAQWRAMAVRQILPGASAPVDEGAARESHGPAATRRLSRP